MWVGFDWCWWVAGLEVVWVGRSGGECVFDVCGNFDFWCEILLHCPAVVWIPVYPLVWFATVRGARSMVLGSALISSIVGIGVDCHEFTGCDLLLRATFVAGIVTSI